MATRLGGPVEIEVKLDTKKAQDQLDKLSGQLKGGQKQIDQITKAASATKPTAGGGAARSPGVQASSAGGPAKKRSITDALLSAAKANALRSSVMSSPIGQMGAAAGRLMPESAMGVAKFAGAAALGYAAASVTAQRLPDLTYALGKIANLESELSGLQSALEGFRQVFSKFESGVMSIIPSASKTKAYVEAAFRLGADVPQAGEVFKQEHLANTMQREVDKKFEQFKRKEVYAGGGEQFKKFAERSIRALGGSFSRSW
jgi:hypothetical protein